MQEKSCVIENETHLKTAIFKSHKQHALNTISLESIHPIFWFVSSENWAQSGSAELADIFADCIYFINQADTEAPFALGLFVFGQLKNEAQCL